MAKRNALLGGPIAQAALQPLRGPVEPPVPPEAPPAPPTPAPQQLNLTPKQYAQLGRCPECAGVWINKYCNGPEATRHPLRRRVLLTDLDKRVLTGKS